MVSSEVLPFRQWSKDVQSAWRSSFEDHLLNVIVDETLPFRFVDSESFRRLVNFCVDTTLRFLPSMDAGSANVVSLNVPVPHRDTVRRRIHHRFDSGRLLLRQLLQEMPPRSVSISLDEATDRAGYSYLGIMCHFVDANWKYRVACLDLLENCSGHSFHALQQFVDGVLSFYQLTPFSVTTDNAANLRGFRSMPALQHFRCSAHVLQLAARDLLQLPSFAQALEDVDLFVTPLRWRSRRRDVTKRLFPQEPSMDPGRAPKACVTRWNSELRLVEHFLARAPFYERYCCSELSPKTISRGEFICLIESLQELCEAVGPLFKLTMTAQMNCSLFAGVLCEISHIISSNWKCAELLRAPRPSLVSLWRTGSDTTQNALPSSSRAPSTLVAAQETAVRKRQRRNTNAEEECTEGRRDAPSYAMPNGTSVRARSCNGSRRSFYPGMIRHTLSDGSVAIDFVDGDFEIVAAEDVLLMRFEQRRDVPLTEAYKVNVVPNRRKRSLSAAMRESLDPEVAEYLWEGDPGSEGESGAGQRQEDADSDCSSDDDSVTESSSEVPFVDGSSSQQGTCEEFEQPFPTTPSESVRSSRVGAHLTLFQRRAAAHMLLLAGEAIRIESPEVALAVMLNPITAYYSGRSEEEQGRVMGLATVAFVREVASELERLSSVYSAPRSEQSCSRQIDVNPHKSPAKHKAIFSFPCIPAGERPFGSGLPTGNVTEQSRQIVKDFWSSYATSCLTLNASHDPLMFWADFGRVHSLHPAVNCVVRRYLSVPPSAAACERLFSVMTSTRIGRPRMGPSMLRELVLLRANKWLMEPMEDRPLPSTLL